MRGWDLRVAIYSNPDIVLVDEVLSVGDAAFRRRALEALRDLIASGKTVLFISHDMWNVRRLCSQILWMEEGQVRAYGDAGEIAERYMNEVNLQALANQGSALQSHRGGTGEVRYEAVETLDASGAPAALFTQDDAVVVRATYRAERAINRPVFQIAIVDVDTGVVVTSASTAGRDGTAPCRRTRPDRHSLQSPAAAAAPVRASTVDHRWRSPGVVRHGDGRSAICDHGPGRRRGQPCRRTGWAGHRPVR